MNQIESESSERDAGGKPAQRSAFPHPALVPDEIILGVTPSAKHDSLLASYLMNAGRGVDAVADMIVSDLRDFLDLGAVRQAADHLIVLRFFLADHPGARFGRWPSLDTSPL